MKKMILFATLFLTLLSATAETGNSKPCYMTDEYRYYPRVEEKTMRGNGSCAPGVLSDRGCVLDGRAFAVYSLDEKCTKLEIPRTCWTGSSQREGCKAGLIWIEGGMQYCNAEGVSEKDFSWDDQCIRVATDADLYLTKDLPARYRPETLGRKTESGRTISGSKSKAAAKKALPKK